MARYASGTEVSTERSRMDIERTLTRYGATGFMYGWHGNAAVVAFELANRRIKFLLPFPEKEDFSKTPQGRHRKESAVPTYVDRAMRQRWRALLLVIKAKLEAVESGITEFEDEFMAHIVMPDGKTLREHLKPRIAEAYKSGRMPPLLMGPQP